MGGGRPVRWILGVLTLIIILLGAGSLSAKSNISPQVDIIASISHLTQEDYERVGTNSINDPTIDDFRYFKLRVEIKNSKYVSHKELEVPEISNFKKLITTNRYWFGNEVYQNNDGENLSLAETNFVIYFRGLNEEQLKEILGPLKIHIGWVSREGNKTEKEYILKDFLTFHN
jgi:hypothetical protein